MSGNKNLAVILMITGLLVGTVVGYGVSLQTFQSEIDEMQALLYVAEQSVVSLETQVSSL